MKVGALILGILGGLIALSYGVLGFGLGSIASSGNQQGSGALLQFVSLAVPIAALVGAGIVLSKPAIGAALMGGSAVVLVLLLGFNFFSLLPVVLLGIGGLLGFLAHQEASKAPPTST